MTRQLDEQLLESWLAEGPSELSDRVIHNILDNLDDKRAPWWLPGRKKMNRMMFAIGGIAVLAIAVGATGLYFGRNGPPGVVGPPSPTVSPLPRVEPTESPSPSPTWIREGRLEPGVYVHYPFWLRDDRPGYAVPTTMSFTFSVPSRNWEGHRRTGVTWYGDNGGVGFGFLRVFSLNGDPCKWVGAADDVAIGPSVDDLADALVASTNFETSQPVDTTLGGYSGKYVQVTMPDTGFAVAEQSQAIGCSELNYRIWNARGLGLDFYAQGPSNRWGLTILDVEGYRIVVLASDFADSPAISQTELQAMVDSIQITP